MYTPSHFDDLESFFYVLYFMVVCYPATGSRNPRIPTHVLEWFSRTGGWAGKVALLSELTLPCPIVDTFHPGVSKLVVGLHRFFRRRHSEATSLEFPWCPHPDEGYDEFLRLLDEGINSLQIYEPTGKPGPELTSTGTWGVTSWTHNVANKDPLHHGDSDATDGDPLVHVSTAMSQGGLEKRPRSVTSSPGPSKRIKSGNTLCR